MYIESPSKIGSGASRVPKGCRVRGEGGHEIRLSVAPGACGWEMRGEKIYLQVYLQYDAYVQQVNSLILIYVGIFMYNSCRFPCLHPYTVQQL